MGDLLGSRERVLRAMQRRDADHIPLVFRASPSTMRHLREQLSLETDLAVLRHFASDAIAVSPAYLPGARQPTDAQGFCTDVFGNRYRVVREADGESSAVVQPVLAHATCPADLECVRWPTAAILDLPRCRREASAARETGLAVYGGIWASLFTMARACMGEEQFLISTIESPELVRAVVKRLTDVYLELNRAYLDACGRDLDVYYFGSDLGTQRSLFISEEMCRDYIFPGLRRLAEQAHGYGLQVMYHTCGAVSTIVEDLIKCGIDVLDPVQVSAAGMEPENLKQFTGRIAFHGAISTQTTLPFASATEVDRITRATLSAIGPGGIIAGPDQDIIGHVPLENLYAMCRAIRSFAM